MTARTEGDDLAFADKHFTARLTEELSELIAAQSEDLFRAFGIDIPVKSCSLMLAIRACEPASARTLSDALVRSHQLVSQKLPKLLRLGLIAIEDDPADGRQKLYRLTAEGRAQLARFQDLRRSLENAYDGLERDAGPLSQVLRAAIGALRAQPLADRVPVGTD